jgi:hypothetical protein
LEEECIKDMNGQPCKWISPQGYCIYEYMFSCSDAKRAEDCVVDAFGHSCVWAFFDGVCSTVQEKPNSKSGDEGSRNVSFVVLGCIFGVFVIGVAVAVVIILKRRKSAEYNWL